MAISPQTVEEVQAVANVYDIISDYLPLKKIGVNYVALCPFHTEKTPSFVVSPTKNIFKCFGCGISGDAIKFVMEYEKISFSEAIVKIANRYGIKVKYTGKDIEAENRPIYEVMSKIAQFYQENLYLKEEVKNYIKQRDISPSVIRHFSLGYSPKEEGKFESFCKESGIDINLLKEIGILSEGKITDKFRGRLIFPIRDLKGNIVAFGGRAIQSGVLPKYLNSPESKIYNKSKVLYGLFENIEFIKESGEVIIVEGYMDLISLWQIGIKNVVATLGTAFTEGHVNLLKRFVKKAYIMFDSDEAGKKASIKAAKTLLSEGITPMYVFYQGFKDPDELSKAGIKTVKEILKNSEDFLIFLVNRIKQTKDIEDVKERLKIYQKLYEIVIDILRSIKEYQIRYSYISVISQELGIPASKLQTDIGILKTPQIEFKEKDESKLTKLSATEKAILKTAYYNPLLLKNCDFCDKINISKILMYYFDFIKNATPEEYEELRPEIDKIPVSIPEDQFYKILQKLHQRRVQEEERLIYSVLPEEEKEKFLSKLIQERKSNKEVLI
ncbi:MAG: DNA primase [Hydrogenothermaceae bacterium]